MDPAEITDEATLRAWLETRPQAEAVQIARRAAMRVLPLFWEWSLGATARQNDVSALPILRGSLVSGVGGSHPSPEIRHATSFDLPSIAISVAKAHGEVAALAIDAVDAAADGAAAEVIFTSPSIAALSAENALGKAGVPAGVSWACVQVDCSTLAAGDPLDRRPLWPGANPLAHTWAETKARLREAPEDWSFWIGWYDAALNGTPPDWTLLERIALIPSGDWDKGPAHLNALIARIREDHALAATANGERIEVNPATGLARLVPETDLPGDIAGYARRKMDGALALFDGVPPDQYTGLAPARAVVRRALDGAADLPMELYDACASAARITAHRARTGDIPTPEQDALIADFLHRIREAGADILAHDAQARDVLARRNAIAGNDALLDNRDRVTAVAADLAGASEGHLAQALPRDAAIATDPDADPEERKVGAFRLVGRFLRFAAVGGTVLLTAAGGAIYGGQQLHWLGQKVVTTPQFRQVVEMVFRYLGMG